MKGVKALTATLTGEELELAADAMAQTAQAAFVAKRLFAGATADKTGYITLPEEAQQVFSDRRAPQAYTGAFAYQPAVVGFRGLREAWGM
jgi:hypothetical protein